MTMIVDALKHHIECAGATHCHLTWESYEMDLVSGRPGSVCFALKQRNESGAVIVLAEGFSIDGRLAYDRITLPEPRIEAILTGMLDYYSAGREVHPVESDTDESSAITRI